jgi:hypothetical protein
MSHATVRKVGLKEALRRRVFVVFVSREKGMRALRAGKTVVWTVPSSARPGDMVLIYKPAESAGFPGPRKPPYEVFVAAAIVYRRPKRFAAGIYTAPIDEVEMFPNPVPRTVVTDAFPEWKWLKSMRGYLGVEVPPSIAGDLFALIDRLAYGRSA